MYRPIDTTGRQDNLLLMPTNLIDLQPSEIVLRFTALTDGNKGKKNREEQCFSFVKGYVLRRKKIKLRNVYIQIFDLLLKFNILVT